MQKLFKILFLILFTAILVYLIADYFNRQGISGVVSFSQSKERIVSIPFQWDMDSPEDIELFSENIKDAYFKDGQAYLYYESESHFDLARERKTIDIKQYHSLLIGLYSRSYFVMQVHLIKEEENGSIRNFYSEGILFHDGWNRIEKELKNMNFYERTKNKTRKIDWNEDVKKVNGIRISLSNYESKNNYVIIDFIRLRARNRIELTADTFEIWGDGRNIELDREKGTFNVQEMSKPAVLAINPIGFDPDVNKIDVNLIPQAKRHELLLSFRRHNVAKYSNNDPDVDNWTQSIFDAGTRSFYSRDGNLLEMKFFFPAISAVEIPGFRAVQFSYKYDSYAEFAYSFHGIERAPDTSGSRYKEKKQNFPVKLYKAITLEMLPASFTKVNLNIARGYKTIGVVEGNLDRLYIERIVRLYRDFVDIWAVRNGQNATNRELQRTARIISSLIPHAAVIPTDRAVDFVKDTSRENLSQKISSLPPSYLILDRGPVFYTALVLIAFIIIAALRKRLEFGLAFRAEHLKHFGAGLIASVVFLLPLIFIFGLGSYRYVNISEIVSALYRYGISSFIQELFRIIAIEYIVRFILNKKKERANQYTIAVLITSVFFSLGHLGYPGLDVSQSFAFLLITFFAGLVFGYVYIKARSITPPFILHLTADIFLFAFTTM